MSVWVGIIWEDAGPARGQEAAQLAAVPRTGETLIAPDGSRWTIAAVEWPLVEGHVVLRVRPEVE